MDPLLIFQLGVLGLIFLLPPAVFVLSVVAFALAPNPPARAPQNLRDAWKMFGVALLPVPVVVALHYAVPVPDDDVHLLRNGCDAVVLALFDAFMVGAPLVLGPTWFRRLAPSRAVRVLFTVSGLSTGVWFACADYLARCMRGI